MEFINDNNNNEDYEEFDNNYNDQDEIIDEPSTVLLETQAPDTVSHDTGLTSDIIPEKKKRGRKPKNATASTIVEEKKRFCDECDSKGRFHKKDCSKEPKATSPKAVVWSAVLLRAA